MNCIKKYKYFIYRILEVKIFMIKKKNFYKNWGDYL